MPGRSRWDVPEFGIGGIHFRGKPRFDSGDTNIPTEFLVEGEAFH